MIEITFKNLRDTMTGKPVVIHVDESAIKGINKAREAGRKAGEWVASFSNRGNNNEL